MAFYVKMILAQLVTAQKTHTHINSTLAEKKIQHQKRSCDR